MAKTLPCYFISGRGEGSLSNVMMYFIYYDLKVKTDQRGGRGQFSTLEFDPIYNNLLYASQFNS